MHGVDMFPITVDGMRMLRPKWFELIAAMTNPCVCRCGSTLWHRDGMFPHWELGHFDVPDASPEPARHVALWETA